MIRAANPIPGNSVREILRIDSDVTGAFLIEELRKVRAKQDPTKRSNPRYVSYVRRLQRAIDARR